MTTYTVSDYRDLCINLTDDSRVSVPPVDKLAVIWGYANIVDLHKGTTAPPEVGKLWLKVADNPALDNGSIKLHDGTGWVDATPTLWAKHLKNLEGSQDPSYKHSGVGVPASSLGADRDVYYRRDIPGGIYFRAFDAWNLIPGTVVQDFTVAHATSAKAGVIKWATQADTNNGVGVEAVTPNTLKNLPLSSTIYARLLAEIPLPSASVSSGTSLPVTTPSDGASFIRDNGVGVPPTLLFRRAGAWVDVGGIELA